MQLTAKQYCFLASDSSVGNFLVAVLGGKKKIIDRFLLNSALRFTVLLLGLKELLPVELHSLLSDLE